MRLIRTVADVCRGLPYGRGGMATRRVRGRSLQRTEDEQEESDGDGRDGAGRESPPHGRSMAVREIKDRFSAEASGGKHIDRHRSRGGGPTFRADRPARKA